MMSSYIDKHGLYNVKLCYDGEPSGNDGAIVTAYAHKAGIAVDRSMTYFQELRYRPGLIVPCERLPGKITPYPSRDTLLGWSYFDLINKYSLLYSKWSFSPLPVPRFHLIKFIAQAILCLYEDRNYFWQHGFGQIYRLAFSVPLQDRAFYYSKPPWYYRFIAWVDKKIPSKTDSGKLLRYLKYDIKPDRDVFIRYFGEHHPITVKALE